jgi:hypothetical protein
MHRRHLEHIEATYSSSRVREPMNQLNVINLPNPSGRTRPCGLLQQKCVPETERKKLIRSRARPFREADNLTAISEPIVYIQWDPEYLTTL